MRFLVPVLLILMCTVAVTSNGQELILRNFERVDPSRIRALDENGIRLDDGRLVWLDDIIRASIGPRQSELDPLLKEIGNPVFRIRSRLESRDWVGAMRVASRFAAHPSVANNARYRFLVNLALMRGNLIQGNRERAIEPFLNAALIQRQIQDAEVLTWSSVALPVRDCQLLCSSEFMPIWFNRERASEQFMVLEQKVSEQRLPHAGGVLVYLASLSLAAGNGENAQRFLAELKKDVALDDWQQVLSAEYELEFGNPNLGQAQLAERINQWEQQPRLMARFLQGSSYLAHPGSINGINASLALLTIPATSGGRYPEFEAASLYHAIQIASSQDNSQESEILRGELLKTYGNTYHGRLLRSAERR